MTQGKAVSAVPVEGKVMSVHTRLAVPVFSLTEAVLHQKMPLGLWRAERTPRPYLLRDNPTSSGLSLLGSIADQGICSDVGNSSEGCSLIEVVGPIHLFEREHCDFIGSISSLK